MVVRCSCVEYVCSEFIYEVSEWNSYYEAE